MVINQLKLIFSILLFSLIINVTLCLFEDQVGKFDWKQSYIGKLKHAEFDSVKKIIIGTHENVLASLNLKNGQIIWRNVLENDHSLDLLYVNNEVIVTVSGDGNTWYIRGWNNNLGTLEFEWSLNLDRKNINSKWLIQDDRLIHVVPGIESDLEISSYQFYTGENNGTTTRVTTNWNFDSNKCILTGVYYVCCAKNDLFYMDVTSRKPQLHKKHFAEELVEVQQLKHVEHGLILITNSNVRKMVVLHDNQVDVEPHEFKNTFISVQNEKQQNVLYELTNKASLRCVNLQQKTEEIIEINLNVNSQPIVGICKGQACRILAQGSDDSLFLMQLSTGKILWTREEALSRVVAVEFIELPVSELDASIEHEFTSTGDVFVMLYKRLSIQLSQIKTFLTGQQLITNNHNLIRDNFGFHKLIVLVTQIGKLYAIDTLTGKIVWTKFVNDIKPFKQLDQEHYILFEQRNVRYSPLSPVVTLLAKHAITENAVLYSFDPITGDTLEGSPTYLNFKVKQSMLIPYEDAQHLKGIAILTENDQIFFYPKSSKQTLQGRRLHMYTINSNPSELQGYSILQTAPSLDVKVQKTWEIRLDSSEIVALSVKPHLEKVHSQGRVLSDRSVLYKYVNPNLIAIATHTRDPLHKNVLSVYLIDGITGLVIFSANHKRSKGPIKLVHSENWIVYSYTNEKFRRNEIAAMELYEGITQSNSTAFSSFALSQLPHIETQAYILPVNPLILTTTLTERGITNKHLLLALSNGFVAELPWAILEPRGSQLQAGPEEGYIPYIPELPIPSEAFINYNQTLERIKGIHVSPARLESTSLVLVYGLDLFYTRVAPSKTFDVLKEDFDHWLIVTVLSGLIMASYVTKQLASRKALKQAWK